MKKVISLNESELAKIIEKAVNSKLNEAPVMDDEDMEDDDEESLTRIVQDEEAFTIKEDATPNTSMLERRAINQPYASISPVKNIKHGLSMMYRNEA